MIQPNKKTPLLRDMDDQDLKAICSTESGRRFIAKLVDECGVYRSSFDSLDANGMIIAKNEGARNIGLFILSNGVRINCDFIAGIMAAHTQRAELFESEMKNNSDGTLKDAYNWDETEE